MQPLARIVHRSFRRVERFADWLTGSAGPVFISIALLLLTIGVWTFFLSMFPLMAPLPPPLAEITNTPSPLHIMLAIPPALVASLTLHPLSCLRWLLAFAWCWWLVYATCWHYYMACTESPGYVIDGLSDALGERRIGPGSSTWWTRGRRRAALASLERESSLLPVEGVEPASPVRLAASDGGPLLQQRQISTVLAASGSDAHSSSGETLMVPADYPPPSVTPPPEAARRTPHAYRTSETNLTAPEPSSIAVPPPRAPVARSLDAQLDELADSDDLFPLAKMCQKCSPVSLWMALSVLPPELRSVERETRRKRRKTGGTGQSKAATDASTKAADLPDEGESDVREWLADEAEKRVPPPKPERTHHCSVCKVCVLKYDHHCPWLNQCVGIGNERYFVLFMFWLVVSCSTVVATGWPIVVQCFEFRRPWSHPYTPRAFVLLTYAITAVMGFALGVMCTWQLLIVARGETSVESSDNAHYRTLAKRRGQRFINVYDVGWKRNLELFFNVGEGSEYSYRHALLPIRIPPYTNGWHWAKRRGLRGTHAGVVSQEILTDSSGEEEEVAPSTPLEPPRKKGNHPPPHERDATVVQLERAASALNAESRNGGGGGGSGKGKKKGGKK